MLGRKPRGLRGREPCRSGLAGWGGGTGGYSVSLVVWFPVGYRSRGGLLQTRTRAAWRCERLWTPGPPAGRLQRAGGEWVRRGGPWELASRPAPSGPARVNTSNFWALWPTAWEKDQPQGRKVQPRPAWLGPGRARLLAKEEASGGSRSHPRGSTHSGAGYQCSLPDRAVRLAG